MVEMLSLLAEYGEEVGVAAAELALECGMPTVAAVQNIIHRLNEPPIGTRRITGLVIGFVGVALLVGLDIQVGDLIAILQIVLVVIGYAIGPIIIAQKLHELPAIGVITASLILASVVYAPFAIVLRPGSASPAARVSRARCSFG